jgi:hypothetical protein
VAVVKEVGHVKSKWNSKAKKNICVFHKLWRDETLEVMLLKALDLTERDREEC